MISHGCFQRSHFCIGGFLATTGYYKVLSFLLIYADLLNPSCQSLSFSYLLKLNLLTAQKIQTVSEGMCMNEDWQVLYRNAKVANTLASVNIASAFYAWHMVQIHLAMVPISCNIRCIRLWYCSIFLAVDKECLGSFFSLPPAEPEYFFLY